MDRNTPVFFGFGEYLVSLALMALAWTTADFRYRFRIRTAPLPMDRLTFWVVGAVGVLGDAVPPVVNDTVCEADGEEHAGERVDVELLPELAACEREGLEAGAIGFSTSPRGGPEVHAGTPSTFATQDEIVSLGNLAGQYGGSFQFNGFGNVFLVDP